MVGSIERGYAGKSLWKWDELPEKIDRRYYDYARRMLRSVSMAWCLTMSMRIRISCKRYLNKIAKLADIFRPYGIRVFLSANFSSPFLPNLFWMTIEKEESVI